MVCIEGAMATTRTFVLALCLIVVCCACNGLKPQNLTSAYTFDPEAPTGLRFLPGNVFVSGFFRLTSGGLLTRRRAYDDVCVCYVSHVYCRQYAAMLFFERHPDDNSHDSPSSRHKLKLFSRPVAYYHNSSACFRPILCAGDIEANPGPVKYPCTQCDQPVKSNQRGICCDTCNLWTHAVCSY